MNSKQVDERESPSPDSKYRMGALAREVRAKQQEDLENNTNSLSIIGTSVQPAPFGMSVYRHGEITGNPKLKQL